MARFARVVAVGYPHHVTHREHRRDDVFLVPEERERYLGFVGQYARAARLDVWGYCLMTSPVHLIVVPRREDWLRDPEEEAMADRLRRTTHTSRPCGEAGFVRMLETELGRPPLRRGPKPKQREEEGQLDSLDGAD
jgi:hypothetical protein